MTVTAVGMFLRVSDGVFQESFGFWIQCQNNLIQLSLSRVLLSAIASALRVDRTTRGIFLDVHAAGHTGAVSFALSRLVVEKMRVPWYECSVALVENDASLKEQKVISLAGRAGMRMNVS